MTHIALTCPRLGFTLGVDVWSRAGRLVDPLHLVRVLEPLGRTLARGPNAQWLTLEVGDSTEAMLAWSALKSTLDDDIAVQSIVASRLATEMIFGDPTPPSSIAANVLRELFVETTDVEDGHPVVQELDFPYGCAAARHFTRLIVHAVPAEIAEQRLPIAPLVLWSVADGEIITIDREPFVVGRADSCDLQIVKDAFSRRHFLFERSNDGWRVRDHESASGIYVNGQHVHKTMDLAPGMVVQIARPYAWVVLAVQPAR